VATLSCSCIPPTVVVWVTHMKTTVDIADPLLARAKRLATRRGTTLRAVIEDALRKELAIEDETRTAALVRTHTFGGRGLQRGLSWDDWGTIRSLAYEGRGG
jgi:hypothetical protein